MEENKINIPEDLQQICRDLAEVAIKHNLYSLSGNFRHRTNWGGDINFGWVAGRHEEDKNQLTVSSQLMVYTKVKL